MKKGFTLVEIVIAMAVGMIVLGAVYAVVNNAQRSSSAVDRRISAIQDARAALEIMAEEISMASCNPNYISGVWKDNTCVQPAAPAAYTTVQNNKGIVEATSDTLTIAMDIDATCTDENTSTCVGDGANEIITYNYVFIPANRDYYMTRGTNCNAPQPFLGESAASGNPPIVRVENGAAGISVFRYFDGRDNELSAPINIPAIRRILITLVVDTDDVDPMTGQRRRMYYSTSVIPRNHPVVP